MTATEAPSGGLINELMSLLAQARASAPDADAEAAVDEIAGRLSEPLRVAIAGKVKAGKSTLLNALVGDHLAPTDARECTRVVTWYRDAHTYRVEAFGKDGSARQCPFRRKDDELEIDLGSTPVEDLDRLVVWWPSASLAEVTLIDTPGIGSISTDLSARTYTFLTTDDEEPAAADAVLYLVRHLHNTDVRFLEAFHDDDLAHSTPVNAVGVLSRADEIGACRLDAMDSARRVAARYGHDPRIRQLCRSVIPVAGLVAQAGATLREDEFRTLASLVGRDLPDPADLARPGRGAPAPAAPARPLRRAPGARPHRPPPGHLRPGAGDTAGAGQRGRRPPARAARPADRAEPAAQGPLRPHRAHGAAGVAVVAAERSPVDPGRDDRVERP